MSPKLPQVSSANLIKALERLDYKIIRQKGSHIRLRKETQLGKHNITIPNHKTIAKGTLKDVITKVSQWNSISAEKILNLLK